MFWYFVGMRGLQQQNFFLATSRDFNQSFKDHVQTFRTAEATKKCKKCKSSLNKKRGSKNNCTSIFSNSRSIKTAVNIICQKSIAVWKKQTNLGKKHLSETLEESSFQNALYATYFVASRFNCNCTSPQDPSLSLLNPIGFFSNTMLLPNEHLWNPRKM